MSQSIWYVVYAIPLLAVWLWFGARRSDREQRNTTALEEAREAGLTEPVSLHPVIDPARCLGCGACVSACPEAPTHQVLGLINGKAQLISPTDCIGHGACKIACPTDAIQLVFGTATRGVTLPVVAPNFESSVPGVFVAGELGGMGLIRNALSQGRQAVEAIKTRRARKPADALDLVIVGAGPAGFAAAITATALKLNYVCIDQEALGGCVFQYPRGKLVMTSPIELPLVGKIRFSNTSKEELLAFWQGVEARLQLRMRYQERLVAIERSPRETFVVVTPKKRYEAATVLLAIGRRGTPRKLGVTGEDQSKVVYRLIDPDQYAGKKVLVVGGGDSALEAAASIAETRGASVVLSYRGEVFGRAKQRNRDRVAASEKAGRLLVLLNSNVKEIGKSDVTIEQSGKVKRYPNDAVIINAGGVLPNDLLKAIGVTVETKYGTA
jgi:thioredoxin reductase (NADPH)